VIGWWSVEWRRCGEVAMGEDLDTGDDRWEREWETAVDAEQREGTRGGGGAHRCDRREERKMRVSTSMPSGCRLDEW
jgi:hypothetical protein